MTKKILTPFRERFFTKVYKKPNGCWEWAGGKGTTGYGYIGLGRREDGVISAHRASYEIHFGAVPKGKLVCHRCNNRGCVNPEHLYAGTYKDNLLQSWEDGGHAKWRKENGIHV